MPKQPDPELPETVYLHGNDPGGPSRTQKRMQARADETRVRELVLDLVALSPARLGRLELPEELADGIRIAAGLPASKARVRQIKQLTRMLAELDHETLRRTLANPGAPRPRGNVGSNDYVESWRVRLTSEGDSALGELLAAHPTLDRKQLRLLVRSHKKAPEDVKAKQALVRALAPIGAGPPAQDLTK